MHQLPAWIAIWMFCVHCAAAQTPPVEPLSADSDINQTLDALDRVGRELKNFTAEVSLTEQDVTLGTDPETRTGRVYFDNGTAGEPRLRVVFEEKEANGIIRDERIEYLLAEGWLTDRNYRKKIEVRRQVLRPGEKMDVLKLGEGPFPLPIGQSRADVLRLFEVKKMETTEDEPKETVHLQLVPRPGTDLARKFASMDIWVDFQSHMPIRIDALDANQGALRQTELKNVTLNGGLDDADFTLPTPAGLDAWDRHEEAFE